ncbi:hypothetical protein Q5H92_16085 [Hymenobacter sp. M29]|uniref:Anti-sigma factor n=1 Tax=Hymenobacter mellowenesis TaxID=3063995 RepID=A0ABT9ADI1_9BACT|nr:hypothetical protein [Hymenobacter sp. M29]MDO7847885.1 hypothetical protein [Hymenobacter sp. M29]
MSAPSELPEPGRPHLRRAIAQLPQHEPADELWPRIAASLDAEATLARAVTELPIHQPDDALWNAIAARLDAPAAEPEVAPATQQPAGAVVRRLWPTTATARHLAALAASVLLVLAGWWGLRAPAADSGPRETVAYTQEQITLPPAATTLAADPLEAEGRAFIDAHCQSLPAVCQSANFQSLRSQLLELETEEKGLAQYTRQHGNSPELVQHQTQVATLKATVTRELIRLLIVS